MRRGLQNSIIGLITTTLLASQGCISHPAATVDRAPGRNPLKEEIDDLDEAGSPSPYFAPLIAAGVLFAYPFTQLAAAIDRYNGNTPIKAARAMDNPDYPDARIQGINDLVNQYEFAHHPPYTIRYAELAEKDPDYLVRATAIRALNISHDKTATPIFIAALEDTNEPIRLEACKALNNIPDERAIPALLRRLDGHRETIVDGHPQDAEEDADVRIAAAQALRRYPKLEVATALVSYLNERNFAVAWQSHRSLEQMTNADWDYDEAAWLRYLSGPKKPLAS